MQPVVLLKNKLIMPVLPDELFLRQELSSIIRKVDQFPVVAVTAGAGYGKTTAVIQAVSSLGLPYGWYNPGPEDDNVYIFSAYLAGALDAILPGIREWYLASVVQQEKFDWKQAFSTLMYGLERFTETGGPAGILVIDDWHLVQDEPEIRQFFNRFLAFCPGAIHIVLLSRQNISLSEMARRRAIGQVLDITGEHLSFGEADIQAYAAAVSSRKPDRQLSTQDIEQIYCYTEGWIIAIRLVLTLFADPSTAVTQPFAGEDYDDARLDTLFQYLAQEILDRQPPDMQEFLLKSSLLSSFTPQTCLDVFGDGKAGLHLDLAKRRSLFLTETGRGIYRYHNLFLEFLRREAEKRMEDIQALHLRVGSYYLRQGEAEAALQHFIQGQGWADAQGIIRQICLDLVYSGRSRTLDKYVMQLPAEYRHLPEICLALGEDARYSNKFSQALTHYDDAIRLFTDGGQSPAGLGKAYRCMAEVYLDIIQPLEAQVHLRQAYQVLPADMKKERADLLGLMAENMINQGRPRQAHRYIRLARHVYYPFSQEDTNNLEARILLRTGKTAEALRHLEDRLQHKLLPERISFSFRESSLIRSICQAYLGEAAKAIASAREGILVGEKLGATFVTVVAYTRLGHGLLIANNLKESWAAYRKAESLSSSLGIVRAQTELLQGKCLWHALSGDWGEARRCGERCREIAENVQDRWFTAISIHTLGMGAALCGRYDDARRYFYNAGNLFQRCGDQLGRTAVAWWHAYISLKTGDAQLFQKHFSEYSELSHGNSAEFIGNAPSMLGNIHGFAMEKFQTEAGRLGIKTAPRPVAGQSAPALSANQNRVPLRIQTLGNFRVWRGEQEILGQEWRRESSKQILVLLLSSRKKSLPKETMMTILWPDDNYETANTRFKVALSNLMNVLEPHRPARAPSVYLRRHGQSYRFEQDQGVDIDAVCFEESVSQAGTLLTTEPAKAETLLREAIGLYQGDYLNGIVVDEVCLAEQERLRRLYIKALEWLAELCVRSQSFDEALYWAETIFRQDSCWERAYQIQMLCYRYSQNIVMLTRTYNKCCSILEQEMGIRPSRKTTDLYQRLMVN